jgi:competence protein ComEA
MLARLVAALAAAFALAGPAGAADANTASRAELESIPGIGPAMAGRILEERDRRPFAGWDDLRRRVKGIGAARAGALSAHGLSVAGAGYAAPAAAVADTAASR